MSNDYEWTSLSIINYQQCSMTKTILKSLIKKLKVFINSSAFVCSIKRELKNDLNTDC